ASGLTLEIVAGDVPLLEGAMDLAEAGFVTRAVATNETWLEPLLDVSNAPAEALVSLLIDAQTSGGLLIALPEASVDGFGETLSNSEGETSWAAIGRVTEKGGAQIRLV
ncbi:MAG: AIR synthase-related protein, partial [Candidatus Hydrogenedentes bacterium]|nr:AIR synthase-related protein [Candidatus Hydrogenedentota bacterium]